MAGESLVGAIGLVYLFSSVLIVGLPLLVGHILLLCAKLWSFRSYMFFGALVAPILMTGFVREQTIDIVLMGVVIGCTTALVLRLTLNTQIGPNNCESWLTGRLAGHPFIAMAVAALFTSSAILIMQMHIWLRLFSGSTDVWEFLRYISGLPFSASRLACVVWMTSLLERRYKFARDGNSYLVAAGLAPVFTVLLSCILNWQDLGLIFFYLHIPNLLILAASGWISMAIYTNVIGLKRDSTKTDLKYPNPA